MDDITALAQELFGTTDIPEGYMREVKRHVATAAAWLGLATDSHHRAVYWLDGQSLGVLSSFGLSDADLQLHKITGHIRQLDNVETVDLSVAVDYNAKQRGITDSGRRLAIGPPNDPDVCSRRITRRLLSRKAGADRAIH